MPAPLSQPPKPARFKWQFTLRGLLILMVLLAAFLAHFGNIAMRVRNQQSIVARIKAHGGSVAYDYQHMREGIPPEPPPGPKYIQALFGRNANAHVRVVYVGFDLDGGIPIHGAPPAKKPATNADFALLSRLPELQTIVTHETPFDDIGIGHIAQVKNLRELNLDNPKLSATGLAQLRTNRKLEVLYLEGTNVNDDSISHLHELSGLKHLKLNKTSISSTGIRHLVGLNELHTIEFYSRSQIGDEAIPFLAQLPKLEVISFGGNKITDAGLVPLRGNRSLRDLGLSSSDITDEGLKHIAEIPGLRKLNIAGTSITDEGLAAITKLTELEELYLFDTGITDAAAVHFTKLKQLRILGTEGTNVTEKGLLQLSDLQNLRTLSVGPNVSGVGMTQLRALLPNCDVELRTFHIRPRPQPADR